MRKLSAFGSAESNSDFSQRLRDWFRRGVPAIEREDRIILVDTLTEGSRWSVNFGVMLGCSVIIAGLGLLQDSVAVVIGAMLVAPLMTPLIGIGLALVQGNFDLLAKAALSMLVGTLVGLGLGIMLRLLIPGNEITTQVSIRGAANILDLFIAFFAGTAAGYAMARPKLSGALPGVAIAVALVPPLAAAGIAFGSGEWAIGFGALLLYLTNLIAIVLASAFVFRIHGIQTSPVQKTSTVRMKRIMFALGSALIILLAPLAYNLLDQLRLGQGKPASLSLSETLWRKLDGRLEQEEGIDFLAGARASSGGPKDVTLVITSNRVVPWSLISELDQMIDDEIGLDIDVKFNVLSQGLVGKMPSTDESAQKGNEPDFQINE